MYCIIINDFECDLLSSMMMMMMMMMMVVVVVVVVVVVEVEEEEVVVAASVEKAGNGDRDYQESLGYITRLFLYFLKD